MKEIGIYVHIPFCKRKCKYCDFISFQKKDEQIKQYMEILKKEILQTDLKDKIVKTIYIGGGTPSYIDSKYIVDIINIIKSKYRLQKNAEITIEVNPGTVTKKKLQDFYDSGINRLSIGLQSTNDEILECIGRIHSFSNFLETYTLAREVGFKNINVDLMLALPNQTIEILKDSVNKVIDLNPEHISVYSLILEEGTKLYEQVNSGELLLPEEETEREMYYLVKQTLEKNGYIHYEISNFSRKGFESKHNMDCWNQKEYMGFGLSAHSYIGNKRFSNTTNFEEYIKKMGQNYTINEIQTREDKMKEYMMLGLRKIKGISIRKFKQNFSENPIFLYRKELNKLVNEDLIEIDGDNIKLSQKGLDFANIVWEEFV